MFVSRESRAILALLGASFLFGATFVVVKSALTDIEPLAFVAWRFLLGGLVLALLAIPRGRSIWIDGGIAGLALFAGYAFQTAGLVETSASNSALITGMFIVITPLLSAVFSRRAPGGWVVLGAVIAFCGVALLTGLQDLELSPGDALTLACAVAFAAHIVALSRYASRHPLVPFTAVQLVVTAVLAFGYTALFEGGPSLPERSVWGAIALTGLGVGVGAYLLQIWAQRTVGPATAAVVLAAEPVFGVAVAWVVLGERLTPGGWIGAALIVTAIYLVVVRQPDEGSRAAEAVTPAH